MHVKTINLSDHKAHSCNRHPEQGLANVFCKGPDVNVSGFADTQTLVTTA